MITNIELVNFKSWEKVSVPCGSITGLFGKNSSGKSSILQFILLLKQTKEATDRAIALNLSGPYTDLGVFQDVIFSNETNRSLEWCMSFHLNEQLVLSASGDVETEEICSGTSLSVSSSVKETKRGLIAEYLEYKLGNAKFALTPKTEKANEFELNANVGTFRFKRNIGRKWPIPGPIKSYSFPDQAKTYFQNAGFLSDLEKTYDDLIDKIYYLGPLRDYPKRQYLLADSKPRDVGIKGEHSISAIRAMTASGERRKSKIKGRLKPFQEIIAYWLEQLGLVSHFQVSEISKGTNLWQALVKTRPSGPYVKLTDVGFGISQVLPVITLLQYVPERSTVLIEQPEIHLHPLAQANLADLVINAVRTRNIQVIIESHSEHFLLRLQRRIAEGEIDHSDVKLYFCDAPRGNSHLHQLDLDLYGNILNWPKNFMGDQFGETVSAELARLKRQQEQTSI